VPSIVFIDDRLDIRESIADLLQLAADELGWRVFHIDPLPNIQDYRGWIAEEEIAVVLTDERLHEIAPQSGGNPVSYEGHDLVERLRGWYPSLPIYVVTAYPHEGPFHERFGEVEDVIHKDMLTTAPNQYVERFVRAGSRFIEEHQKDLARLSTLSRKVARGHAEADEIEEMHALQERVGMAFVDDTPTRSEYLTTMESKIEQLEELERSLRELLER
jgi:DNA-binding NtrC family response regulator